MTPAKELAQAAERIRTLAQAVRDQTIITGDDGKIVRFVAISQETAEALAHLIDIAAATWREMDDQNSRPGEANTRVLPNAADHALLAVARALLVPMVKSEPAQP